MSDDLASLQAEIAKLLSLIEQMAPFPDLQRQAREQLAEKQQRLAVIQSQSGGLNLGIGNTIGQTGDIVAGDQTRGTVDNQGRINGVAVGVNLGTIIYGRDIEEDERRRLVWYLDRLSSKLNRLPLRGLDEKLDQGNGVSLPQVYITLAISTRRIALDEGTAQKLVTYFEDNDLRNPVKQIYHVDNALPQQAIIQVRRADGEYLWKASYAPLSDQELSSIDDTTLLWAMRSFLATEVITWHQGRKQQSSRRIVLLGDPGGGKSTFLRHLAWALSQRGLDQLSDATALFGWQDQRRTLPIILSLRSLAGQLAADGVRDTTVYAALLAEIASYNIAHADDMFNAALHQGAVLLLFDGLDEVPLDAIPGVVVDRHTTLQAVRDFAQIHTSTVVVLTCRVRAFNKPLQDELGWPIETIAPFTLGQIRHFIPAWYAELVHCDQIAPAQAERMGQLLLDSIIARPKLRAMAENPLLLTMMALVLYNKGELPRDRPQLYERILELLLGQWDKVRDGQSLAEAIGEPDWGSERIRPLLDLLSLQAHAGATSEDGRGRLARRDVRDALELFLIQAGMHAAPAAAAAVRCLDYFNHRSGLLVPDDAQDSYTFAHLTLQEHCAGRALVLDPNAAALVLRYRADDRWREPILLGLGVVQQTNPALLDRVLSDLIDADEAGLTKLPERRQRDLIFAAEIGVDRDWGYLRTQRVNVDRLQRDLKRGLVALLQDKAQFLPVVERVRAGFLLGDLGDPRVPVKIEEWQRELAKVQAGDTTGYFCRVEPGTYTIGSAADDPDAADNEKPQHTVTFDEPFWIARYPITNVQWQAWVDQAGGNSPYFDDDADLNRPNQPVIAVDWNMCNAFCARLSAQLGADLRLPTEQEWEAAARGAGAYRYPWGDDWQDDRAATEEDQETRGSPYTVPVGCYQSGAAQCGALDMAGNVWEWTASEYRSYPGAKKPFTKDRHRVLRGGWYESSSTSVRCGARDGELPISGINFIGFRVVVAPRAH